MRAKSPAGADARIKIKQRDGGMREWTIQVTPGYNCGPVILEIVEPEEYVSFDSQKAATNLAQKLNGDRYETLDFIAFHWGEDYVIDFNSGAIVNFKIKAIHPDLWEDPPAKIQDRKQSCGCRVSMCGTIIVYCMLHKSAEDLYLILKSGMEGKIKDDDPEWWGQVMDIIERIEGAV